jgi:hypothetical protein
MIMKKFVFASMMCLMAIAANAQVLTAKTISKVYADLTSCMDNSEFVYNAEQKDDVITALCVYSKADRRLKPVRRFEYTYDASGLLLRRVAYRWNELADDWLCTGRHDYSMTTNRYSVEYSRWNVRADRFDQSNDKMTYTLLPCDTVQQVCCYHRERGTSAYQLKFQMDVPALPVIDDTLMAGGMKIED